MRRFFTASIYEAGSSSAGEAHASPSRSGGKVGSLPVAIMEAENPWGSCTMAFSTSMMPGSYPPMFARKHPQASKPGAIINGPMAPLVDAVTLGMVRRGKQPLNPQGVSQLGRNYTNKFPARV